MTDYFFDDWTGSDGAAWSSSYWTSTSISALNTTGSSATIQGNKGRLNAGTLTGFAGHAARRYTTSTLADAEWKGKVTFTTSVDGDFEAWIRAATGAIDGTGYILNISLGSTNTVKLIRANSYSYTTLDQVSTTISQSTEYNWRFHCVGTALKVKVWTGSEPSTWDIDTTDSVVTAAGYAYLHAHGGNSSGFIIDFDDVYLTDGANNEILPTGSITPTGTVIKDVVSKTFTGSVTATGAFTGLKVVTATFTGSVTPSGVMTKNATKKLSGTVTATGLNLKDVPKTFTASVTPSGAFGKALVRTFTGSVTATSVLTAVNAGRVYGRPGRAKITTEKSGTARIRARKG